MPSQLLKWCTALAGVCNLYTIVQYNSIFYCQKKKKKRKKRLREFLVMSNHWKFLSLIIMSQVCQLMQVYQFHPVISLISLFLQIHLLFSNLFIKVAFNLEEWNDKISLLYWTILVFTFVLWSSLINQKSWLHWRYQFAPLYHFLLWQGDLPNSNSSSLKKFKP